MNGSAPSTIIAPAGAEVCTHGGGEEVVEDAVLEEELGGELEYEELEVVVGAEDDVEIVEGAALLEDGLSVLVDVVVGLIRAVVETAVLMQEQPLDIFDGKFEQAEAHVGNATEVVARV